LRNASVDCWLKGRRLRGVGGDVARNISADDSSPFTFGGDSNVNEAWNRKYGGSISGNRAGCATLSRGFFLVFMFSLCGWIGLAEGGSVNDGICPKNTFAPQS